MQLCLKSTRCWKCNMQHVKEFSCFSPGAGENSMNTFRPLARFEFISAVSSIMLKKRSYRRGQRIISSTKYPRLNISSLSRRIVMHRDKKT